MTSSRLPIGVAQTASGTAYQAPSSASNADERGAHEARLGPELRRHDAERRVRGCERLAAGGVLGRREHELAGRLPEAAADEDDLGIEEVRERADRCAEERADLGEARRARRRLPPRARSTSMCASASGPHSSRAAAVGGGPGDERLHMPSAVTVPLARRPVRDDDHVPDLRPPAVEPVVEDDAAADARAEREQDEAGDASPRAELPFGERSGVPVVLDADREPEALAGVADEVEVVEGEVRRAENACRCPARGSRGRRSRSPPTVVVENRVDRLVERLRARPPRRSRGSPARTAR